MAKKEQVVPTELPPTRRSGWLHRPPKPFTCVTCNHEFITFARKQTFCSDCYEIRRRELGRKYYAAQAAGPKRPKTLTCACGRMFTAYWRQRCKECERKHRNALAVQSRAKKRQPRPTKACAQCGTVFQPKMRTQRFCCNDCKLRFFSRVEYTRPRNRNYYWKNPERSRALGRAWTAKHRDRLNLKARQKRRLNAGFTRIRERQNRRKQRALRRAQFRLQTILEQTMLTEKERREWQQLPENERWKLRRALLAKAREMGIKPDMESLK